MSTESGEKFRCTTCHAQIEIELAPPSTTGASKAAPLLCPCGGVLKPGWAKPTWIPTLHRHLRRR
jgi:NAD-dependent SIR2 family protein deacetylase